MSDALSALADRHMRQDPTGFLVEASQARPGSVRIVVQPDVASTYAGQHTAWLLVNLLARQFRVVTQIALEAPNVQLLDGVAAFGTASTLRASLTECLTLVAGEHVSLTEQQNVDVALVLGALPFDGPATKTWYLHADGWRWYVGTSPLAVGSAHTRTAIGPYLAACFAAGEAFKLLRGLDEKRGRYIDALFGSAWSMETGTSWDALQDGPTLNGLEMPHAYFAGAGAVAQACMLTLGASGVRGRVTTVDHDDLDLTNNNRYVLATRLDDNAPKVDIAFRYFRRTHISCRPAPVKWDVFVAQPKSEWSFPDLIEERRRYQFPIVLSCVDKNRARHDVQNARPDLIIGGSTDGLTARAQVFDPKYMTCCLKCFNPPERSVEVAHAMIERARAATEAERLELCSELGIPLRELTRILAAAGCGALTPADIERFGSGPAQMSVGFVSAAAGVLQAAQFIRSQGYSPIKDLYARDAVFAAFGTGRLAMVRMAFDQQCNCQTARVEIANAR